MNTVPAAERLRADAVSSDGAGISVAKLEAGPSSQIAPADTSSSRDVATTPPGVGTGTLIGIALLALVAAASYLLYQGADRYKDLFEEPKIAAHLARGHGFRTPLDESAGAIATSWCAPIYPYVMAGVYRAQGIETHASLDAMLALNALCLAAVAGAACLLGVWIFRSRATGVVAGVIVALHPIFLWRTAFYWDTLLALAIFAWLVVLALWIRRKRATVPKLAILGAGLGLLALTNASYAITFPLIVLLAVWDASWVGRAKLSVVALLVFMLVITPWTIRNYRQFGKLFFIRGGVNMEMWLANQPLSYGWVIAVNHPRITPAERQQMLRLGENAYYEECGRRFTRDYEADPSRFWWRSWNRFVYLFFGDPKESGAVVSLWHVGGYAIDKIALNGVPLVLALAGAWTARRLGYRIGWLLLLALLAGTPFFVTYVSYRYVMPTRLLLMLPCAFLLVSVYGRLRDGVWASVATIGAQGHPR